jgi:hypothetical protein
MKSMGWLWRDAPKSCLIFITFPKNGLFYGFWTFYECLIQGIGENPSPSAENIQQIKPPPENRDFGEPYQRV